MPDKSFENNMRRQMGDFSFPASDAVWQKLEVDLQKRKKRRWAIIWFFSGLVLVGTGIYFMTRQADLNTETIKESSLVSNKPEADVSENLSVNPKNTITDQSLIPESKSPKKESSAEQFILKKENEFYRQEIRIKSTEKIVVDSNVDKSVEAGKNEESPMVLTAVPVLEKVSEVKIADTPVAVSISTPKSNDSQKKTDSIAVAKIPPAKETNKGRLSFGIRFEAGRSANSESSGTKMSAFDLNSGLTTGTPILNTNPYTQEPAFGWSIGVWVKKPVSKRINLLTGLMYNNYRTSTTVGTQVQSPLLSNNVGADRRAYFQPGNAANYQNNYHLLSVPVEMALQINKGKKLPVSWVLGLEPGWMVGSNAVIKDTSGYLYSDKSMYNRFQLGLQTGISFRLFQKSQYPIELGPIFRYMLTPAFKSGSGYDGHLNFMGVRADWTLQ